MLGWLLDGDGAVRHQAHRDLLDDYRPDLQQLVSGDGDAAALLAARGTSGHWGRGFYQPKWTCSHYALLELRDLEVAPDHPQCQETVALVASEKARDGGVNPSARPHASDVCINGMFLAYGCYFGASPAAVAGVVDFVLAQQLADGGFNCHSNRSGARVSSVHTTSSVIDGFAEYLRRGYEYRTADVSAAMGAAAEALLARRLYQRRGSGEPIRVDFTRLHHPARWYFDVLRGLEVVWAAGVRDDPRLDDALELLVRRRRRDGRWAATSQYPGETQLDYPRAGEANRWVTLRALRVLRRFGGEVSG